MAPTFEPGVPAQLAAFAAVLVAVFGAAFGLGRAVGPIDERPPAGPAVEHHGDPRPGHDEHGG